MDSGFAPWLLLLCAKRQPNGRMTQGLIRSTGGTGERSRGGALLRPMCVMWPQPPRGSIPRPARGGKDNVSQLYVQKAIRLSLYQAAPLALRRLHEVSQQVCGNNYLF